MILVTGGSGFVGAAVVRQLLAAGHEVRALIRPISVRTNLARLPVEIVQGDLRDAASLRRAMAGIRFVFHVAADYRLWARQPEEIVRTRGSSFWMASGVNDGSSTCFAGLCSGGSEVMGGDEIGSGRASRTTTRRDEKCSVSYAISLTAS